VAPAHPLTKSTVARSRPGLRMVNTSENGKESLEFVTNFPFGSYIAVNCNSTGHLVRTLTILFCTCSILSDIVVYLRRTTWKITAKPVPAPLMRRSDFGSVSQIVGVTLTLHLWEVCKGHQLHKVWELGREPLTERSIVRVINSIRLQLCDHRSS
jgi:hypothetical protein